MWNNRPTTTHPPKTSWLLEPSLRHSIQTLILWLLHPPQLSEKVLFFHLACDCIAIRQTNRKAQHICLFPLAALTTINSQNCSPIPTRRNNNWNTDFSLSPKWESRRWKFTFTHASAVKKEKQTTFLQTVEENGKTFYEETEVFYGAPTCADHQFCS